jgi:DNA-binding LacI/PurR family transcriptional regulator
VDEEGVVPVTARRATIADVAALAGVSRGAVSKVMNGTGAISPATAARVHDAVRKLNWTPNPAAVALRRSRSRNIGLVLNRPGALEIGPTSSLLISGLESVLAPRSYGLLLYLIDQAPEDEARAYRNLADDRRVDGVVLTDSRYGDGRFALMRSLGLPAVLIGTPADDDPVPYLDNDPPGAGVDDAVAHLLELGHTRIAYIGGPDVRVQARARREMFDSAMAEAGHRPVASIAADYSPESSAEHTGRLLDGAGPRPTAIVYGSDQMAIAGISAARGRGLRVPADLSVIGFDGLPIGAWLDPPLTTVHRDAVQRGSAIARMLLALLGEQIDEEPHLSRPRLLLRGSTAGAAR